MSTIPEPVVYEDKDDIRTLLIAAAEGKWPVAMHVPSPYMTLVGELRISYPRGSERAQFSFLLDGRTHLCAVYTSELDFVGDYGQAPDSVDTDWRCRLHLQYKGVTV